MKHRRLDAGTWISLLATAILSLPAFAQDARADAGFRECRTVAALAGPAPYPMDAAAGRNIGKTIRASSYGEDHESSRLLPGRDNGLDDWDRDEEPYFDDQFIDEHTDNGLPPVDEDQAGEEETYDESGRPGDTSPDDAPEHGDPTVE